MYIYLFFVVIFVQNILFVIVEDAYISSKYTKDFQWLTGGDEKAGQEGSE